MQHLTGMLKNPGPLGLHPQKPLVDDAPAVDLNNIQLASPPNYKLGEQVATRLAYGTALAKVRILFFFFFQLYKHNTFVITCQLRLLLRFDLAGKEQQSCHCSRRRHEEFYICGENQNS